MTNHLQVYVREEPLYIPGAVDLVAILLFAMSGVLAAMRRGYDIVGVFTLALVVGAGGGLIRDGIFLQQGPPALVRNWQFLPAVLAACVLGWLVNHWIVRFHRTIAILDAVGLSIFSTVGLLKSLEAGLSVPAAMLVGVVNASGGGLLRDILTREEPLLFKPGQFYVLASLTGSIVFVSIAEYTTLTTRHAQEIAMASIFVLRILAIVFNWRTGPLQPRIATSGSALKPSS